VTGLVRYHAALLVRSYRWIPPLLFFGVVVGSATAGGAPASDAFGFAAAMLVPTCAWLVRVLVTAQPAAARACVAAAGGTARAHVSALLVAAGAGVVFGLGGAPVLLATASSSGPGSASGPGRVLAVGLLGELVGVLVGVAVGAVANPPVVRAPAPAVLTTVLLVVLALVVPASPAPAAIRATIGVHVPTGQLLAAAVLAVLAVTASALVARARGVD